MNLAPSPSRTSRNKHWLGSFALVAASAGCTVEHGGPLTRADTGDDAPSPLYVEDTPEGDAESSEHAAPATDADFAELEASLRGEAPSEEGTSTIAGSLFGGEEPADVVTTWAWVPDTWLDTTPLCMDGSATGLGLSLVEGATKTLVFFQSGGACFNGTTCTLSDWWLTNDHFDDEQFQDWALEVGQAGMFNRAREENAFKDYNFVFFPYCSGDVFGGLNEDGPGGRVHVGYRNVGAYLDFLEDTLDVQEEWVVAGSSAGGFGATYNYSRIQKALDPAPVTLLSDAAPVFSNDYTTACLQQKWKEAWNLDATLAEEFDGEIGYRADGSEAEGIVHMLEAVIAAHPENRFAMVAGDEDTVIRFFYGFGHSWGCNLPWLMSKSSFQAGVHELRDEILAPYPNASLYTVHTSTHMFLNTDRMYDVNESSWPLTDWLATLEEGHNPGSWW